jgi:glutamate-1-semialdehyde 2,1-aminomutase
MSGHTERNDMASTDIELWHDVESTYLERTQRSRELYEETAEHVPAGVGSTFREWTPHPLYVDRAEGVHLHDVDGNSYLDFGMNNGAGMSGHAHPAITAAIQDQAEQGTLYTKPSTLLPEAARELTNRWDAVDAVRFTNSGTESTMHAIRVARAHSGKDKILKIEGSYHGVHDYVLISKSAPREKIGHAKRPTKVVESAGVPDAVAETVEVGPWNDLEAIEDILRDHPDEIGTIIVEPIVMNVGVTEPYGNFLQGLRDLCDEYGLVYVFDEVKTGVKVAPGGAAEYYDVEPDLVAMAKSIGGNVPVGAFGGAERVMAEITDGAAHFGTYNANPLALCAVVTQLRDVLTEDAYDLVGDLGARLADGYEDVMADHGIAGHVASVASQGTVSFFEEPVQDYRDFIANVDRSFHENYWFEMLNRGVLAHPHDASQQWTISVQHTADHVDEHLETFKQIAPRLADEQ